jgi:DNA-binding transcriptional regulator YhcF (GntR family)
MTKGQVLIDQILDLLLNSKLGLSVNKMAEKIVCSRTTISKYLKELEQKHLVFEQDIGQYKIWHHKDGFIKNKARWDSLSTFFEPFYDSLMHNLPKLNITPANLKELGNLIDQELNFSDLITDIIDQNNTLLISSTNSASTGVLTLPNLSEIAQLIMQIIDTLFRTFDPYHWDVPMIFENEGIFILRMVGSEYVRLPSHFYLLSGIIEGEMNRFAPVTINIHQILEKEQIVDIKFKISTPLNP